MKIGITGGIGSGKSFVCNMLREQGFKVYDCDTAAKRIMRQSADVRLALTSLIGHDAYDGTEPNKARIAAFILSSESNAAMVNAIVHPAVAKDFQESGIDFMECALLFQSGFDALVDKKVCVTAPLETRIERIMKRDSIPYEKAMEWIKCQMPQEEMAERSDVVIINDGIADLKPQIARMMALTD